MRLKIAYIQRSFIYCVFLFSLTIVNAFSATVSAELLQIINQQRQIINNQEQSNLISSNNNASSSSYQNNLYNNSLNFNALSSMFSPSLSQNDNADHTLKAYNIDSLPQDDKYIISLSRGVYSQPSDMSLIDSGNDKSNLITNIILDQLNDSFKKLDSIKKNIYFQINPNWAKNLKQSSRDEILRDLSLQLSLNNYLMFQSQITQNMLLMINVAKLIDNKEITNTLSNIQEQNKSINETLVDMDNGILNLNKQFQNNHTAKNRAY